MLDSQSSFGYAVGAATLFYPGNFSYATFELSQRPGDGEFGRSLTLGTWWMVIILVVGASGCHLANNNPTASSAIIGIKAENPRSWPRGVLLPARTAYALPLQPVTLWSRGSCKKARLKHSIAICGIGDVMDLHQIQKLCQWRAGALAVFLLA